jgi:hypothetical protein
VVDWTDVPLKKFRGEDYGQQEDGTWGFRYPYGTGEAQGIMANLSSNLEAAYERVIEGDEAERFEQRGEVPVIRDGRRGYEPLNKLTLRDLPAVLDALRVLEQEERQRQNAEAKHKAAERRNRDRIRAKERRKLKKLGEW